MTSFLEVAWVDAPTGVRGWLVIDRLIRGGASGGLRMRDGCTLDEVRDLAHGMSLKEAVVYSPGDAYVPFGGGKGGIDCSPHDPRARDVMRGYLTAMRPLLEAYWSTGEDLGVRQDVLDEVAAEVGLRSTIEPALRLLDHPAKGLARVRAGFAVDVAGISLAEVVGGYGVAQAVLAAAGWLRLRGPGRGLAGADGGPRAVVQGFGSMGGATARYLAAAGVPVVGICDADGMVANRGGLDVERLLGTRDAYGRIDRSQLRSSDVQAPGAEWLTVPAEILVPAAVSYALTGSNAADVRASLVVEAANAPTTPEAAERLHARGVTVVPDFVANVATNAWWWWTLFGDIEPEPVDAFAKISATLRGLVMELLDRSRRERVAPRPAAVAMAGERLAALRSAGVAT